MLPCESEGGPGGWREGNNSPASLGNVVRSLFLGEVCNVARHGGGDDEGSGATLLEVSADSLGTVESTVEVSMCSVTCVV